MAVILVLQFYQHDSPQTTTTVKEELSGAFCLKSFERMTDLFPSILMSLQICLLFHLNEVADGGRPSLTVANKKLSLALSRCLRLKSQPEMGACYKNSTKYCKTSEPSGTEKQLHGKCDTRNLETHFYRTVQLKQLPNMDL